ncbi:hypothetical protein BC940DRAFT_302648 [Gongronella butleri]|nr:hypothetical protein BC940DRAFT_302648 [Gongronella butleri]
MPCQPQQQQQQQHTQQPAKPCRDLVDLHGYAFCTSCGVDTSIFSHEDHCPLARRNSNGSAA